MSSPPPKPDPAFDELVRRFLDLANAMNDAHHRSRVSAAILSAAARYNAFTWMHREINPEQTPAEAAEFFAEHYRAMFRDHREDLASLAAKR